MTLAARLLARPSRVALTVFVALVSPAAFDAAPAILLAPGSAPPARGGASAPPVIGTWTGDSTCVGDRPACKNEVVVYRFVPVDGQPRQVALYADKVIEGKRVPMGALRFVVAESGGSLTCEFRIRQTHGVWAYEVSGDAMTGTLVILPDKTLGRRVSAHRVSDDQVPSAPPLGEYGDVLGVAAREGPK